MDIGLISKEVDRNYDFFQRNLSRFLPEEFGRYALLRHGEVIGFFDTADEASDRAAEFLDQLFSIQIVDPEPINLGLYSNG